MVRNGRSGGDREFGEALLPLRSKALPTPAPRALLTYGTARLGLRLGRVLKDLRVPPEVSANWQRRRTSREYA